jgi:hypothetical protein
MHPSAVLRSRTKTYRSNESRVGRAIREPALSEVERVPRVLGWCLEFDSIRK